MFREERGLNFLFEKPPSDLSNMGGPVKFVFFFFEWSPQLSNSGCSALKTPLRLTILHLSSTVKIVYYPPVLFATSKNT